MRRRTMLLGAAMLPVPVSVPGPAWARGGRTVDVLYAGSLLNLMERGIGPAFDATGDDVFRGYAGGSGALVNQIRGGLRRGDVFISADPALNDRLGAGQGDHVRWYVVFARSPLVIGYNPRSAFADALRTRPWYEVLQRPGIRIGRTDPVLDPKGALTVRMLQQAGPFYRQPDLAARIMGNDTAGQVRPEENLVGRLQSGQIDVGFFYAMETADLHIPTIPLPPELSLAARYSVTILRDAPNPEGAARFVAFLLGQAGGAILRQHGLETVPPAVVGDGGTMPAPLRPLIHS
ncbi:extracellular solute-binding protein [Gluconacetobacter takamatsuzukensis]|uniref:Extracellular solute-binding protein n=1 Tax=Gluconacetobacter takamatsuzukensis TaxID=1286190 RepID=A0A7W4KFZ8_9PROT|nr:extracellular solute-binding protein [Gluconacetobacter takamatsuzukensis]MBB2206180.1 extracellular solute-binding protein [Gluconacetobacter takamatsuzukensis]